MEMDAIIRGLLGWHRETLSAWTMVGVIIGAFATFASDVPTIPTFLVMLHAVAHAPFSIAYHCNNNIVVDNYDIKYIKNDVAMIYISHIIMHLALSMRSVPWQISSIVCTIVICLCLHVADKIWIGGQDNDMTTAPDIRRIGVSYAWIFLLHYIPILFKGNPKTIALHICIFCCILLIYKYSIVGSVMGTRETMNIDNTIMHFCLILNNMFAHYYAKA